MIDASEAINNSRLLVSEEFMSYEEITIEIEGTTFPGSREIGSSWKFGEGGITDGSGNVMGLQEAASGAGRLRREEYIAQNKRQME